MINNVKRPNILVVGSLVMDLIVTTGKLPKTGETVTGNAFSSATGGKGANQAMQARRLGADVTMVGCVGNDVFGHELSSALKREGVNVAHVRTTDRCSSATGNVIILRNDDGTLSNRIIVSPGANMELAPKDVAFLREEIAGFDMVLLQFEIPSCVNDAVIELAVDAGVPVMLNPAPFSPLSKRMLTGASYISPNETEAEAMFGFAPRVDENGVVPQDVERIRDAMSSLGISNVIITLGDRGAMLISPGEAHYFEAVKDVNAVDPTAAGDSFVGAFSTARCLGYSDADAMELACRTAAITVAGMGAQPSLPDAEHVIEGMKRAGCRIDTGRLSAVLSPAAKEDPVSAKARDDLEKYIATANRETRLALDDLDRDALSAAASLILDARKRGNRLHVSGIGKPAHIASYAASLISSTGVPACYLHGTEAVHGSCGQLVAGDVVIFVSNSGETLEMKAAVQAVKNNGCSVIGVSGNAASWLAENSAVHILAHVNAEGSPLNRAPRASILAETVVLQALSVLTQSVVGWDAKEYVKRHPGGALGKL